MGFITILSREAGTITYGNRMIEQDRINLSVEADLGNCSQEAYTATTAVTELTNNVIWFEDNFYIPTGVTGFSFTENSINILATFDGTWSFNASAEWNPDLPLGENSREPNMWMRADQNITIIEGDLTWGNSKGDWPDLGKLLSYSTPELIENNIDLNGLPTLRFVQSGNTALQQLNAIPATPIGTIFMLFRFRTFHSSDTVLFENNAGSLNSFKIFANGGTRFHAGSNQNSPEGTIEENTNYVLALRSGTGVDALRLNGNIITTQASGTNAFERMAFGGRQAGGQTSNIDVSDIIHYPYTLEDNEIETVENYLLTKANINNA